MNSLTHRHFTILMMAVLLAIAEGCSAHAGDTKQSYIILLDESGSIDTQQYKTLVDFSAASLSLIPDDSEVFVASFNDEDLKHLFYQEELASDYVFPNVGAPRGGATDIFGAIDHAINHLKQQKDNVTHQIDVLIFSDGWHAPKGIDRKSEHQGRETWDEWHPKWRTIAERAFGNPAIKVHTIEYGTERTPTRTNSELMTAISRESHGMHFRPNGFQDIQHCFLTIAASIGNHWYRTSGGQFAISQGPPMPVVIIAEANHENNSKPWINPITINDLPSPTPVKPLSLTTDGPLSVRRYELRPGRYDLNDGFVAAFLQSGAINANLANDEVVYLGRNNTLQLSVDSTSILDGVSVTSALSMPDGTTVASNPLLLRQTAKANQYSVALNHSVPSLAVNGKSIDTTLHIRAEHHSWAYDITPLPCKLVPPPPVQVTVLPESSMQTFQLRTVNDAPALYDFAFSQDTDTVTQITLACPDILVAPSSVTLKGTATATHTLQFRSTKKLKQYIGALKITAVTNANGGVRVNKSIDDSIPFTFFRETPSATVTVLEDQVNVDQGTTARVPIRISTIDCANDRYKNSNLQVEAVGLPKGLLLHTGANHSSRILPLQDTKSQIFISATDAAVPGSHTLRLTITHTFSGRRSDALTVQNKEQILNVTITDPPIRIAIDNPDQLVAVNGRLDATLSVEVSSTDKKALPPIHVGATSSPRIDVTQLSSTSPSHDKMRLSFRAKSCEGGLNSSELIRFEVSKSANAVVVSTERHVPVLRPRIFVDAAAPTRVVKHVSKPYQLQLQCSDMDSHLISGTLFLSPVTIPRGLQITMPAIQLAPSIKQAELTIDARNECDAEDYIATVRLESSDPNVRFVKGNAPPDKSMLLNIPVSVQDPKYSLTANIKHLNAVCPIQDHGRTVVLILKALDPIQLNDVLFEIQGGSLAKHGRKPTTTQPSPDTIQATYDVRIPAQTGPIEGTILFRAVGLQNTILAERTIPLTVVTARLTPFHAVATQRKHHEWLDWYRKWFGYGYISPQAIYELQFDGENCDAAGVQASLFSGSDCIAKFAPTSSMMTGTVDGDYDELHVSFSSKYRHSDLPEMPVPLTMSINYYRTPMLAWILLALLPFAILGSVALLVVVYRLCEPLFCEQIRRIKPVKLDIGGIQRSYWNKNLAAILDLESLNARLVWTSSGLCLVGADISDGVCITVRGVHVNNRPSHSETLQTNDKIVVQYDNGETRTLCIDSNTDVRTSLWQWITN